jgi:hypothetical protein
LWVTQAFSHCDTNVALLGLQVEHVTRQVVGSLVVDVVSDGQELVGGSVAGVHLSSKLVLCVLLKLWSDVVVVYFD